MTDKRRSSALNHQNGEKHSDKEIQKKSWCNETQKIVEICVTEQKQRRNKHEEACAWIFHCGFKRNGAVATETDVKYDN